MKSLSAISIFISSLATVYAANVQERESVADLVAQLRLAPTNVDRIALLQDSDFVFDFLHPTAGITTGSAGHTVGANAENFPAVIGNGIAMTIGFLEPCGMNTPHTHPRATEINFVVNGTFRTGMLAENGARFVFSEVPAGSASVFPLGAIHFEQNDGCEPAMFVAAFNNEDPGVDQIAQRYFGLPPDVVGATLGGLGVTEVAGLESKIPNNIAYGTDECLKRCGIKRPDTQLTSQRQPRNQGNMLPDGFAPPAPPPPPASGSSSSGKWTSTSTYAQPTTYGTTSSTSSSSTSSSAKGTNTPPSTNNNLIAADNNNNTPSSSSSSSSGLSPVVIALLVINGILALGILGCLFLFLKSRQGDKKMVSGGGMMGGGMPGMRPIHSFEKLSKSDPDAEPYYDPYTPPGSARRGPGVQVHEADDS